MHVPEHRDGRPSNIDRRMNHRFHVGANAEAAGQLCPLNVLRPVVAMSDRS